MKNVIIAFFAIFISTLNLFPQTDLLEKFVEGHHTFEELTLPYRLFIPENYDSLQSYPLMLTLHGAGERGSDNLKQIKYNSIATAWADSANQAQYPCFILAPQCPIESGWTYDVGAGDISPELATVSDLLDSLTEEFSIDENRLYVTGLSMGGFGTFDMIIRFPDRFAAAIPMSGGGNPSLVEKIAHIPIWNLHGAQDGTVSVDYSRGMMTAFEDIGKKVYHSYCLYPSCADSLLIYQIESHTNLIYTEYLNGSHLIWDASYKNPLLPQWVFSKYRMTPNAIILTNLNSHRVLNGIAELTWQALSFQDSIELWFSPDAGDRWYPLNHSVPNNGRYELNSTELPDCMFGLLRLSLKDSTGNIYGQAESNYFTIDNAVNGTPYVKILKKKTYTLRKNLLDLEVLIGDPDTDSLDAIFNYSEDDGGNFYSFDTLKVTSDTATQLITIDLANLPNSSQARIKIQVTDGNTLASDMTAQFSKRVASGITQNEEMNPSEFQLLQNYPNPFNPTTTIRFYLPYQTNVKLHVYDSLGREVKTLLEAELQPGEHSVMFDANGLASGIYFYQLKSEDYIQYQKALLVK